jgi:hypothetical protein
MTIPAPAAAHIPPRLRPRVLLDPLEPQRPHDRLPCLRPTNRNALIGTSPFNAGFAATIRWCYEAIASAFVELRR